MFFLYPYQTNGFSPKVQPIAETSFTNHLDITSIPHIFKHYSELPLHHIDSVLPANKTHPPLPPHLRDQFLNQCQFLSQICRFLTLFMVSFFSKCKDTFSSAEGVGHFADAPLEHNKSYSYPILFAFLLKLQFAITI